MMRYLFNKCMIEPKNEIFSTVMQKIKVPKEQLIGSKYNFDLNLDIGCNPISSLVTPFENVLLKEEEYEKLTKQAQTFMKKNRRLNSIENIDSILA